MKAGSKKAKKSSRKEITEKEMIVYGKYLQIATFLQHANRVQLRYKTLTFTWFLATFIGIGYSISSYEINLPFHPFLIVPVICSASLAVIGLLWYLDVVVEEKNIASVVHLGLNLEDTYPWLPKPYHNVSKLHYISSYVLLKSVFYFGLALILVLTICFSISAYLELNNSKHWVLYSIIVFGLAALLFAFISKTSEIKDSYISLKRKRN